MPADLYLELTTASGDVIAGDAVSAKFKGLIALDDWKWGIQYKDVQRSEASQSGTSQVTEQKGNDVGPRPSVLSFSKLMDRATTAMLRHMRLGTLLNGKITLQDSWALSRDRMQKPIESDQRFSLVIELTGVRILSYGVDLRAPGDSSEALVEEDWTLDYSEITFRSNPGNRTASLKRTAKDDDDGPGDEVDRLFKQAGRLQVGQLTELWQRLEAEAKKRKGLPDG